MNALFRLRKEMPLPNLIPFRYVVYSALLSKIGAVDVGDVKYAQSSIDLNDLQDFFSEWTSDDDDENEVFKAVDALVDEGLIQMTSSGTFFVGEIRGKRFFSFESESSLFDVAVETAREAIANYGASKSTRDKFRSKHISEKFEEYIRVGVNNMSAGDFTKLHSYMYEVYTGGEDYIVRNKTEYYQTTNMLKAYNKNNVFAIIIEGTLHYDKFSSRGVPTLINVAMHKDDIFKSMTSSARGGKDYMRSVDGVFVRKGF